MNVLMIGTGKGSFRVRGIQLGGAIGARVVTVPSDTDMRWADVVVLVKRAGTAWADLAHRFNKPVVWDALDFWRQPEDNSLNQAGAMELLHQQMAIIKPALVIGATEAMAKAAGGVYLPHHSRPGLSPAPAREVVTTVGYEGTRKYLGRWGQAVQAECDRRGWQFVINPPDLRACDILVAFRDGEWDGWMCRQWKSGVKLVNAMAANRPIITHESAAFHELQFTGLKIEGLSELQSAFDECAPYRYRMYPLQEAEIDASGLSVPAVAECYRQILQGVAKAKAA